MKIIDQTVSRAYKGTARRQKACVYMDACVYVCGVRRVMGKPEGTTINNYKVVVILEVLTEPVASPFLTRDSDPRLAK